MNRIPVKQAAEKRIRGNVKVPRTKASVIAAQIREKTVNRIGWLTRERIAAKITDNTDLLLWHKM